MHSYWGYLDIGIDRTCGAVECPMRIQVMVKAPCPEDDITWVDCLIVSHPARVQGLTLNVQTKAHGQIPRRVMYTKAGWEDEC